MMARVGRWPEVIRANQPKNDLQRGANAEAF